MKLAFITKSIKSSLIVIGLCDNNLYKRYNLTLYLFTEEDNKNYLMLQLTTAECSALKNHFKIPYLNDQLKRFLFRGN